MLDYLFLQGQSPESLKYFVEQRGNDEVLKEELQDLSSKPIKKEQFLGFLHRFQKAEPHNKKLQGFVNRARASVDFFLDHQSYIKPIFVTMCLSMLVTGLYDNLSGDKSSNESQQIECEMPYKVEVFMDLTKQKKRLEDLLKKATVFDWKRLELNKKPLVADLVKDANLKIISQIAKYDPEYISKFFEKIFQADGSTEAFVDSFHFDYLDFEKIYKACSVMDVEDKAKLVLAYKNRRSNDSHSKILVSGAYKLMGEDSSGEGADIIGKYFKLALETKSLKPKDLLNVIKYEKTHLIGANVLIPTLKILIATKYDKKEITRELYKESLTQYIDDQLPELKKIIDKEERLKSLAETGSPDLIDIYKEIETALNPQEIKSKFYKKISEEDIIKIFSANSEKYHEDLVNLTYYSANRRLSSVISTYPKHKNKKVLLEALNGYLNAKASDAVWDLYPQIKDDKELKKALQRALPKMIKVAPKPAINFSPAVAKKAGMQEPKLILDTIKKNPSLKYSVEALSGILASDISWLDSPEIKNLDLGAKANERLSSLKAEGAKLRSLYEKVFKEESIFGKSKIIKEELAKIYPVKYKQIKNALDQINRETGMGLEMVSFKRKPFELVLMNNFCTKDAGKLKLATDTTPVRLSLNLLDLKSKDPGNVLKQKWSEFKQSEQYKLLIKDYKLKLGDRTHLAQAIDFHHLVGGIKTSLKYWLLYKQYYDINSTAQLLINAGDEKVIKEFAGAQKLFAADAKKLGFQIPDYDKPLSESLDGSAVKMQLRTELKKAIDLGKKQILIKYGAHGSFHEDEGFVFAFGYDREEWFTVDDFLDVLVEPYKGSTLGNMIDIIVVNESCNSKEFTDRIIEKVKSSSEQARKDFREMLKDAKENGAALLWGIEREEDYLDELNADGEIFDDNIRKLVVYDSGATTADGVLDKEQISINNNSKNSTKILKELGMDPNHEVKLDASVIEQILYNAPEAKSYKISDLYAIGHFGNNFQVYCKLLSELQEKGVDITSLKENYLHALRFVDVMSQADSRASENHEGTIIKVQNGKVTVEKFS